jgi:hypothetical protein
MAGNRGFKTYLVADGCFTFGQTGWNGNAPERRGRSRHLDKQQHR